MRGPGAPYFLPALPNETAQFGLTGREGQIASQRNAGISCPELNKTGQVPIGAEQFANSVVHAEGGYPAIMNSWSADF